MSKAKQRRITLDAPVTQGTAPERGDLLLGYDLSAGAPALFDPFDRPGPLGIGTFTLSDFSLTEVEIP